MNFLILQSFKSHVLSRFENVSAVMFEHPLQMVQPE